MLQLVQISDIRLGNIAFGFWCFLDFEHQDFEDSLYWQTMNCVSLLTQTKNCNA